MSNSHPNETRKWAIEKAIEVAKIAGTKINTRDIILLAHHIATYTENQELPPTLENSRLTAWVKQISDIPGVGEGTHARILKSLRDHNLIDQP